MKQRNYDSTVARIAGNILSGFINEHTTLDLTKEAVCREIAKDAVALARAVVLEVTRTEPEATP